MSEGPESPPASPPDTRQYMIGNVDPSTLNLIAGQLQADPQVRLLGHPQLASDLLTLETTAAYATQLRERLTAQHPGLILEENAPLRPLTSSSERLE